MVLLIWVNIWQILTVHTTQQILTAHTAHTHQKKIWLKNGQKNWIDIFPKRIYKWPMGIWKDAHKNRNAHKNHHEMSPHTCQKAIIQKNMNKNCWQGYGEKGILLHCWWECKLVKPLWKTVWKVLKKLKIEPPYDSALPLLDIYLKKNKSSNLKLHILQCW